ncbi:MAG: DUF5684 domain-containing protein, partial [Saprospiraceae bacterium]
MGIASAKAWIPGVNFQEWAMAIGRGKYYFLWLLFPLVNIFIISGMSVDLVRSFGKLKFWHSALAVIYPPAMITLIAKDDSVQWVEPAYTNEKIYLGQLHEARIKKDEVKIKRLLAQSRYSK